MNYTWDKNFKWENGACCAYKEYFPDTGNRIIGTIYEPSAVEGYDCYGAEVYDNELCDVIIQHEEGFKTESEAKKWVEEELEKALKSLELKIYWSDLLADKQAEMIDKFGSEYCKKFDKEPIAVLKLS